MRYATTMHGYWLDIHKRTVAAARKAANIETRDKAVMAVLAQVFIGICIFFVTHKLDITTRFFSALVPFAFFPIWYAVKFPTIPPAVASEIDDQHRERVAALENERDAALKELNELRKPVSPPARDPDGIYQHNKIVGTGIGAIKQLDRQIVMFSEIRGTDEFAPDAVFEYHDLILRIQKFAASGSATVNGRRTSQILHAECTVAGRL